MIEKVVRMEGRYVTVRSTDDKEWYDLENTISFRHEESKRQADALDKKLPTWAKDNKQVRIAKIYISESHPYFK